MTFNESVQVFELPTPPPPVTSNDEEAKQKPALPYTKTRMKVKKDTIKFEEIVSTDKNLWLLAFIKDCLMALKAF